MQIFHNATFLPMTGPNDRFDALVTNDDGTIAYTGTLEGAEAFAPAAERIDLNGACVTPGFIDPHSHFTMVAQALAYVQLGGCTSVAEVQKRLRAGIEQHGITPDSVCIGMGYDQTAFAEERHPTAQELDAVSRDVPIVIIHVSGHLGSANTRAYELAGIEPTTPDPEGGHYVRDAAGRILGPWEEPAAMAPLSAKVMGPRFTIDYDALLPEMEAEYLRFGITTCQDGASTEETLTALEGFARNERLHLDVVAYPASVFGDHAQSICARHAAIDGPAYYNHVRIGGHKMILDGSPQGRTAWMTKPYLPLSPDDDPTFCGFGQLDDDTVYQLCREAIDECRQLLVHCNGDAASDQFIRCYARALAESPNPNKTTLRPVMVHCQTARREHYTQMRELGMIPTIFSSHVWHWGDIHLRNFGTERGSRISACRWALDEGLPFTLHNDTPIVPNNMMLSVWCAVNRITKTGVKLDQDLCVNAYDALRAITANGAYQYGEEDRKGTLEVGKLADLAVLDANPLDVDPLAIKDIQVLATVKEGSIVWQRA
ncbi:MAG TPA: amidohydrolase [Candidatus Limicola stercorigallinarum]|nr:amidohydrolase [Candidatus Limicola stercorigallinarum]